MMSVQIGPLDQRPAGAGSLGPLAAAGVDIIRTCIMENYERAIHQATGAAGQRAGLKVVHDTHDRVPPQQLQAEDCMP